MSEENEVPYEEVDQNGAVTTDEINSMISAAVQGDFVNANKHFSTELQGRLSDALDQEKVRIASAVYGDETEGDDYTDEELENMVADVDLEDDGEDVDLDELLGDDDGSAEDDEES